MNLRSTTILLVVSGMLLLLAACFNPTPTPAPTVTPQATGGPTPNATALPPTPTARPVTLKPQELAMTLDQFPLPGFNVTQDISTSEGQVWRRRFTPANPGAFGYDWLLMDIRVLDRPTSASWIKAQDCDWRSSEGTRPTGSFELTVSQMGDGVKACRYEFADGDRIFRYATGTRNIGVFLQTSPHSTASNVNEADAPHLLELMAERQLAIIDQIAPPGNLLSVTTGTGPFEFNPPAVLPAAAAGKPYSFSFSDPAGGSPPYRFQYGATGGFPPFGLMLGKDGRLAGTPQQAAAARNYVFNVCAVDSKADFVCREVSLTLNAPVTPTPLVKTPTPAPTLKTPTPTPGGPPQPTVTPPPPVELLERLPYINNTAGFSIQPPRGWLKDDSGTGNAIVVFKSAEADLVSGQPFVANINVIKDSIQDQDFGAYVQAVKQLLPQLTPGAQLTSDTEVALGTIKGRLLEWVMPQSGINLKVFTLLAPGQVNQQDIFVVTFTTVESVWSKYREAAQQSLTSFRVSAPPPVVQFEGKKPPVVRITYTLPEGQTVTVPGLSGWVSIVTAVGVTDDQVAQAAASAGGTVIDTNARLGLFTLSVEPGKEGDLIARLRREKWVVEASPAFLVGRTQQGDKPVKVVDYPFDPGDKVVGNPCSDSHGNLTALQITRMGQKAEIIDVRSKDDRSKEPDRGIAFPTYFQTGNRIEEAMKTGSAVNASLGAGNSFPIKVKDRLGEVEFEYKLVGAEYRHAQAVFLAMVFRVAEVGPDVPVVISAGNGDSLGKGQDLTKYMEALRQQFPNAARKVRIVEAWWTNPATGKWERAPWSDFSNVGSIGAPGVDVPIQTTGAPGLPPGSVKCNGTSFAAPVVSALVGGMQKASPSQSAGEIWTRFEKVTQKNIPMDLESPALARRLAREASGHGLVSLLLDPPSASIQQGKNNIFRPIAKEANGTIINDIPGSAYTWSSSNTAIATVDKAGFVDGKSPGTATITASIQGIQAKATVTVTPPPTPASTLTGTWTGKARLTTTITGGACEYAGDITLGLKQSDTVLSGTINYDLVGNPANSRVRCPATALKGSAPLSGTVKGGAAVRFNFVANGFNIEASGLSWFGAFIEGDFSGDATGEYHVEPGSKASGGGGATGGGSTTGGGSKTGCQSSNGTLTIGGFYAQLKGVLQGDAGTSNYSNSGRGSATLTVPAGNYTMTWYNDAGELFRRDSFALSPCGTKIYN
ncbi:MAG: Ig-like domain-containing protein [Chloroflexi bacterium]|nr:Ig-like domain-containing protein [Chloroflexota bacterium]